MSYILTLYTGPDCHLCEQAKVLIDPVLRETKWVLEDVNIAENEELKAKYGLRIPVLVTSDGKEKGWPFTAGQVARLIS